MPHIRFESPLAWPEAMESTPRNQQRADHGFSPMSLKDSIEYLDHEVGRLGFGNAVLSLDIEQPLIERLRKKVGSRTGARLQFKYHEKAYTITCDRWQNVEHNIYALHLTLRQWSNIERWGIGNIATLLIGFAGNRSAQAASPTQIFLDPWMEALGLGPTATLEDAVAVYHRRAKSFSSDMEGLTRLNILMEDARRHFAEKQAK